MMCVGAAVFGINGSIRRSFSISLMRGCWQSYANIFGGPGRVGQELCKASSLSSAALSWPSASFVLAAVVLPHGQFVPGLFVPGESFFLDLSTR